MSDVHQILDQHREECEKYGHDWGDTVECDTCGDDRCGVQCIRCLTIQWYCEDE